MAGGSGSILDMSVRLRNNKQMLRRRPFLNSEKTRGSGRRGRLEFKKANESELATFKAGLAAQRKKELLVKVLLALVLISLLAFLYMAVYPLLAKAIDDNFFRLQV